MCETDTVFAIMNPHISGPLLLSPASNGIHMICVKTWSSITCLPNSLRSKDEDFRASQCNITILIYRMVKRNGGLLRVLVRCYYSKLICVCYYVILLLQ